MRKLTEMKMAAAASWIMGFLLVGLLNPGMARAQALPEVRYIAARDAAIKKLKPVNDAGKIDDAGDKAEESARADLEKQMRAILPTLRYEGFSPGKLNLDSLFQGDEGFGMLDGLRFDATTGKTGEAAGSKDKDGKYIEPRAHILVTTQIMFERWLHAHKNWWDKGVKNVPQQIGAALKDESFYTQAISTDAAVVIFNALPVAKPAAVTFAYAMLAGRTQDEIPDAADEVFVAALANGKVYVAYGSIEPAVRVTACDAIRAGFNKRSEDALEAFRQNRIDKKTYDGLAGLREQGDVAFKRCFIERASKQPAFAEAAKRAQALLDRALAK